MASSKELIAAMVKEYGGVVYSGVPAFHYERIPTGFFDLDIGIGGGFPRGKASVVYGMEGSAKTTILLKAIANHQKLFPDQKCVFLDVEGHYDPEWAAILGVDNEKLVYVLPDTGEQAVDIVEAFLCADDAGLIGIDSVAAMISTKEIDNSADVAVVGGSGLVVGKLYRKATLALAKARREGRKPTLILINQVRYKIGTMHGDPETMPGGNAVKFFSSLTLRTYGKDVEEKKLHPTLPAWRVISVIVKKKKIPTVKRNMEIKMALVDDCPVAVGSSYDWPTIHNFLKEYELLTKSDKGKGWVLYDTHYNTLGEIKQALADDFEFEQAVKGHIFKIALGGMEEAYVEEPVLGEEGDQGD